MGKNSTNDPTLPDDGDTWFPTQPLPYNTTIYGTDLNDKPLNGGYADDRIYGLAGDDDIYGFGGHDRIEGGLGHDKIFGGSGNDLLYGQGGGDQIDGGSGNDRIFGGTETDYLIGGTGADIFYFNTADQADLADIVFDFEANDRIAIQYGHGTVSGTATNYREFEFQNASFDQMKALADFVIADANLQHVFITNGIDGFLFSGHADTTETWVALWGLNSVDDFAWNFIV